MPREQPKKRQKKKKDDEDNLITRVGVSVPTSGGLAHSVYNVLIPRGHTELMTAETLGPLRAGGRGASPGKRVPQLELQPWTFLTRTVGAPNNTAPSEGAANSQRQTSKLSPTFGG